MNIAVPDQRFFIVASGTPTRDYSLDRVPSVPGSATTLVSTQIGSTFPSVPQSQKMKKIPYNEGMALYYQIKRRYNDLFRELADL